MNHSQASSIQYRVSSAQKESIMQNKPNLLNAQINISTAITMDYVNIRLRSRFKNKAKQTQFYTICAENKPNQTQFQTTPAQQFHNFDF